MTAVRPIAQAWISTGGTGAQNYDEFADDTEILRAVQHRPHSALGVEMPHCAPDVVGQRFIEALPSAVARLDAAKAAGAYRPAAGVVGVYRITETEGEGGITGSEGNQSTVSHGVFAMVATDEISTSADQPGSVIRNEDVFLDKVRERVALIEATEHLLSAVLLLQTARSAELGAVLARVSAEAGPPAVTDSDHAGRRHEVWAVDDPATVREICELAGGGDLVVADGNHRSLAAQTAGLAHFLAVITTPEAVGLQPYHRLISGWPDHLPPAPEAFAAVGARVEPLSGPATVPLEPGTVHLHTGGRGYAVTLPVPADAQGVDALDHAVVERVLMRDLLGLDPGDKQIRYIGGDYSAGWLRAEVDEGRAAAAVLIAPVRVEDFVRVNLERARMPRKSTWFTPKARAGLVLADLGDRRSED